MSLKYINDTYINDFFYTIIIDILFNSSMSYELFNNFLFIAFMAMAIFISRLRCFLQIYIHLYNCLFIHKLYLCSKFFLIILVPFIIKFFITLKDEYYLSMEFDKEYSN